MLKKWFFYLLLFSSAFSFAQVDSLQYYYNKGEINKAITYGEYWYNYFVINRTEINENYLSLVSRLANLHTEKKDKINSSKYFNILEKNLKIIEKNREFLRQSNYFLGKYYFDNLNLEKALFFFNEVKVNSVTKEFKDVLYFNTLNYFVQIDKNYYLQRTSKYSFEIAIENANKLKALSETLYSKNSNDYITSANNLGLLYLENNNFKECENLFLETFSIIDKNKFDNEITILVFDNLTKLYLKSSDFSRADFYNDKGLGFVLNKFGKKHKEYFYFLSNKAQIKTELGQNKEAVALYDECIRLSKDLYGRESEIYGTMISNSVYPMLSLGGNYENAEKLLLIDFEITKKHNGLNSPKTAMCYTRLGNINMSMKKDEKAIDYLLKVISIFDELKIKDLEYAVLLSNLGTEYSIIAKYDEAEKCFLESYSIKSKILQNKSYDKLTIIGNLSIFYLKHNQIDKHKKYLLEYYDSLKNIILELNSSFGEKENIGFVKKSIPNNSYLSFLNLHSNKYSELNSASLNNELLLKNLSLRNQQRIKNSIEKSNDAVVKEKYQQFVANKRYLTKLEELPITERPENFTTLQTETENLEKDITRQSATFADAKKSLSITWKEIQQKLKPNDVVINLVSCHYYNKKWTDSIMYGAFVIKKDSKFPKYISLFEEKQLTSLLARNTMAADTIQAKVLNKQYSDKAISDLFLKPLEKELNGCKTIYLSPSGLGHQINFKALPISENQTLGEQFDIKLVGSSTSIVDYKTTSFQENKSLEIILYGGIDYAKSSATTLTNETKEVAVRSNFDGGFGYLKGTLEEINKIANQVKTNKYTAVLKTERNATEESIKLLHGKIEPFVLHLATHGFFFEDPKIDAKQFSFDNKYSVYKSSDDPMVRSGLAFAGANKNFKSNIIANEEDDGVLMAKEISNLDLSNCELVVLSACETGLGDIIGSEGVFGLQRAFKMAGVKNIIMSLWKVPDTQTAELFDIFYAECFLGKTIPEAFQMAQSKMKLKYSPYYWAGFVLLE